MHLGDGEATPSAPSLSHRHSQEIGVVVVGCGSVTSPGVTSPEVIPLWLQ
jgi:hypothetical protein